MIAAILGKKIGMTQVYDPSGTLVPVTVIEAGPCPVVQVKTADRDGYEAVQLGLGDGKPGRVSKPMIGHIRKAGVQTLPAWVHEVRLGEPVDVEPGQTMTVEQFEIAKVRFVDIRGLTKGKGYQGVMKRWNFGGQPASHGTERKHRSPGSIASHAASGPTGRGLRKGKRMAVHMGSVRRTSRNNRLVRVDKDNHLLLVKGSIPGANGSLVLVRQSKTKS